MDGDVSLHSAGKRIAVVGGGLVGALNACFFAQKGYQVDLYERRGDIRAAEHVTGRSINLALSHRGRAALRAVGLEDHITAEGIPMHARMIHDLDGSTHSVPYGTEPEHYIISIDRRRLNEVMLTLAESHENVTLYFDHKLIRTNLTTGRLTFKTADGVVDQPSDLIVGCDGAHSGVRDAMMKQPGFDFQQEYIEHGYIELVTPPTPQGNNPGATRRTGSPGTRFLDADLRIEYSRQQYFLSLAFSPNKQAFSYSAQYAMANHFLHIWPRKTFMLIALPNLDRSFTTTLFMPFEKFADLTTQEAVVAFFRSTFPDALRLIGENNLVRDFLGTKASSLVSVKCKPYHFGKAIIMGDAAHAMVPFYGQGMNSGFLDCLIFSQMLEHFHGNFVAVLPAFTRRMLPDSHAIIELAMYNYIEMRYLVNTRAYRIRKKIDNFLYKIMPKHWIPLYTMVTFTMTPYSECVRRREWQDKMIRRSRYAVGVTTVAVLLYYFCPRPSVRQYISAFSSALKDYVAQFRMRRFHVTPDEIIGVS